MFSTVVVALKEEVPPRPLVDLMVQAASPPATIHLVTFVQAGLDGNEAERMERVQATLEKTAAGLREQGYEAECHTGPVVAAAAFEINRVAQEVDADLIVIGLAKRSRIGKALMGSDAQRVLLSAGCPVLSAPVQPAS